jgi:hypothetical protein
LLVESANSSNIDSFSPESVRGDSRSFVISEKKSIRLHELTARSLYHHFFLMLPAVLCRETIHIESAMRRAAITFSAAAFEPVFDSIFNS